MAGDNRCNTNPTTKDNNKTSNTNACNKGYPDIIVIDSESDAYMKMDMDVDSDEDAMNSTTHQPKTKTTSKRITKKHFDHFDKTFTPPSNQTTLQVAFAKSKVTKTPKRKNQSKDQAKAKNLNHTILSMKNQTRLEGWVKRFDTREAKEKSAQRDSGVGGPEGSKGL